MDSKKNNIDIERVSQLANLELTTKQKQELSSQFEKIISFIQKINQLDLKNVKPTAHGENIFNIYRQDETDPSYQLSNKQALANAPQKNNDSFIVPKVISK